MYVHDKHIPAESQPLVYTICTVLEIRPPIARLWICLFSAWLTICGAQLRIIIVIIVTYNKITHDTMTLESVAPLGLGASNRMARLGGDASLSKHIFGTSTWRTRSLCSSRGLKKNTHHHGIDKNWSSESSVRICRYIRISNVSRKPPLSKITHFLKLSVC